RKQACWKQWQKRNQSPSGERQNLEPTSNAGARPRPRFATHATGNAWSRPRKYTAGSVKSLLRRTRPSDRREWTDTHDRRVRPADHLFAGFRHGPVRFPLRLFHDGANALPPEDRIDDAS